MTLEETDIKFECSQCGQRLAIEQSGAGLAANCPICEHPVTVPKEALRTLGDFRESPRMHESGFSQAGVADKGFSSTTRPTFADPDEDEMREELVSSAMENGLLENDLSVAKSKIARLQQHLRKALDDCERLTANATHTQAETKSFQAERQQMKAELAQGRQKMAVWETQVAEARAKISEMASALATAGSENAALVQELERKTAEYRDYHAEGEQRLAKRDEALVAANTKAGEVIYALAAAEDEISALRQSQDETLERLEAAREQIEELSQVRSNLAAAEASLCEEQERADTAESRASALQIDVDRFGNEVAELRRNLEETTTGRDLLEMRSRFEALDAEHRSTLTSLSEREAALKSLTASSEQVSAELKVTRELRDDAERRAEAASENKAVKDNDVLRGIIERQNSVLAENSRELRSLRRGRYALRTAYALFGAVLLILVIFALTILKPHLLGG